MARSAEVKIGGSSHTIEEPKLRRAKLIGKQVARLFNEVPDLELEIEKWSREYEEKTAFRLTRTQAKRQFGAQLVYDEVEDQDGEVTLVPKRDEKGNYVLGPDSLAGISPDDWEGSGNVLPMSKPPSDEAIVMHLFKVAYEAGEEPLMELLALMLVGNSELKQAHKSQDPRAVKELIQEKRDILDDEADIGDLISLGFETYKMLSEQVDREKGKVGEIRARWRGRKEKAEPTEESPDSTGTAGKPDSSTSSSPESEEDTDGATTPSSSTSSSEALVTSST